MLFNSYITLFLDMLQHQHMQQQIQLHNQHQREQLKEQTPQEVVVYQSTPEEKINGMIILLHDK